MTSNPISLLDSRLHGNDTARMKIAQVVSTYPPYRGGMGNVAESMARHLRARGHAVTVFTPAYDGPASSEGDVVRLKPWLKYGNAAFIPQVFGLLEGFDVVHVHYPFFGGAELPAWRRRKKEKQPLILTYHMDTVGKGLVKAVSSIYRHTLFPFILRSADAVTVSSLDYAKSSAVGSLPGIPLHELAFGVDEAFIPSPRAGGEAQLLFVGGLDSAHYFKGLSVLIEALKWVKKPVHLNVVGSGNLLDSYQQQAKESLVDGKITFLGSLSTEDLIKQYQQASAIILPSIDRSEAFGLVLLESQACGTPVIASDLPGVRSVIKPSETGLLVKPGDAKALAEAIDTLLTEPGYASMRTMAAHRVNAHYRWPGIIDQLEEIYQQAIKSLA